MIIGTGDIASVINDRPEILFLAAGVSNSKETNKESFWREKQLILEHLNTDKHIVYFSTMASVFYLPMFTDKTYLYVKHKKEMEHLIRKNAKSFTIVRIGNITWGENPNTLINFIKAKLKNNEEFEVKNEYRYLVHQNTFVNYLDSIIPGTKEISTIFDDKITVQEIANQLAHNKLIT